MIRALKRLRSLRALYLPGDEIPGLSHEEEKRLIEKGYAERVAETKNDEPEKTVAKDPEPVAEKAKADEEAILKTSGKPETKTPRKRGSGKKGSE